MIEKRNGTRKGAVFSCVYQECLAQDSLGVMAK